MRVTYRIAYLAAVGAIIACYPTIPLAVSRELQPTVDAGVDDKQNSENAPATIAKPDDDPQAARFQRFREQLSGVRLVGQFSVAGKEDAPLAKEEYVIGSVEKMDRGDYWLFRAQIKYGQYDVTIPMPLEVKWAGDTPVITLTETKIIGLGTFSARVVIDGDRYAGTWRHGETGGHLFGRIEKLATDDAAGPPAEKRDEPAAEVPDKATGEKPEAAVK